MHNMASTALRIASPLTTALRLRSKRFLTRSSLEKFNFGKAPAQCMPKWAHHTLALRPHDSKLRIPQFSKRNMFIQVQDTPNPNAIKFDPGVTVLESGTAHFSNVNEAHRSPLARSLFKVDGVAGVMLGSDFVSVNKDEDSDWDILKPEIFATIMDFYASGLPVMLEDSSPSANEQDDLDDEDEVVMLIKELLDTRIRPSVQEDGGDIVYKDFVDGIVHVQLVGACVGCASSAATLHGGVERMLMHYIPEVTGILQIEDDETAFSLRNPPKF
eukprot:m.49218 g.49218  ORF g.49218 m.49218 type:complete len:272 (+) comp10604_c0_seq2:173-988(+)